MLLVFGQWIPECSRFPLKPASQLKGRVPWDQNSTTVLSAVHPRHLSEGHFIYMILPPREIFLFFKREKSGRTCCKGSFSGLYLVGINRLGVDAYFGRHCDSPF